MLNPALLQATYGNSTEYYFFLQCTQILTYRIDIFTLTSVLLVWKMSTPDESSLIHGLESLYYQISSPTFEPTVIFETKLAANFQAMLIKANEKSSHEHFTVLIGYLKCVIALLQKDGKFLPCYFEKMDERHGAAIVNILSISAT